jgi:uncharacterized membrane protein YfcA
MTIAVILLIASVGAGGIASVSGFGIGSILTPVLATQVGAKLAVAVVSIPHLTGTIIRFWKLRALINRAVVWRFGLASAVGGLLGALLQSYANAPVLAYLLGTLLVFAGLMGLTGIVSRFKIHGPAKWIAGLASGLLGGLVGNQGGIRSAAMLGFTLSKESFVATATAIALFVDLARMPVYVINQHQDIFAAWPLVLVSTAGVVIGTLEGTRLLKRIPERSFSRIVSALLLGLGIFMFWSA